MEIVGGEVGIGIVADDTVDRDAARLDECAALAARAEALRIENGFEIHGARIVASGWQTGVQGRCAALGLMLRMIVARHGA